MPIHRRAAGAALLVLTLVVVGLLAVLILRPAGDGAAGPGSDPASSSPAPGASAASPGASPATGPSSEATLAPTATPDPTPEPAVVVLAAGDIGDCEVEDDSATAALLAAEPDAAILALGDLAYPSGSDETYAECFGPTWGVHRDRIRPALGNHDVEADGGAAYHAYWGDVAGTAGEGWYAFDLGAWRVVALNSNCEIVDCAAGSAQHAWLVEELAASDARCTLAFMHHPRYSSGMHGDDPRLGDLWAALASGGTDVILAGHDHDYERFARRDAFGAAASDGVRLFVAGTGGGGLRAVDRVEPLSEAIVEGVHGVLRLELREAGYRWAFLSVDGERLDVGRDRCAG